MPTTTLRPGDDPLRLDDAVFGLQPNMAVMHQVVTAQLANRRAGTQSTKTRSEVSGGGAKPWRQKGTGRARQGSTRAPHWRGGGVAFGPKPRSYAQRTPKKMVRLALLGALSDRAAEDRVAVVEGFGFGEAPSTKTAQALLSRLGLAGRVLVVVGHDDTVAVRSFRNLPRVHTLPTSQLNAYDVLVSDWVLFTLDTLPGARPGAEEREDGIDEAVTPVSVGAPGTTGSISSSVADELGSADQDEPTTTIPTADDLAEEES